MASKSVANSNANPMGSSFPLFEIIQITLTFSSTLLFCAKFPLRIHFLRKRVARRKFIHCFSVSILLRINYKFFCTRNAFLWEKKENFLSKTGVFCEKKLLQGTLKLFQTASRDFFSTKSSLLWEKFKNNIILMHRIKACTTDNC
jgi:hypothetical protein